MLNNNNSLLDLGLGLGLDLSLDLGLDPPLIRGVLMQDRPRPRIGADKYYRTQVDYLDGAGNKYPSKYVTVHSYEKNGITLRVCNVNIVYPHAFKKLVCFGNNYSLSDDEFTVVDIATGATLDDWIYDKNNNELTQVPVQGDLEGVEGDLKGLCPYCKKLPSTYCRNIDCVGLFAPFEGDI